MSDLDLADIEAVNGYIDKLENELAEAEAKNAKLKKMLDDFAEVAFEEDAFTEEELQQAQQGGGKL